MLLSLGLQMKRVARELLELGAELELQACVINEAISTLDSLARLEKARLICVGLARLVN